MDVLCFVAVEILSYRICKHYHWYNYGYLLGYFTSWCHVITSPNILSIVILACICFNYFDSVQQLLRLLSSKCLFKIPISLLYSHDVIMPWLHVMTSSHWRYAVTELTLPILACVVVRCFCFGFYGFLRLLSSKHRQHNGLSFVWYDVCMMYVWWCMHDDVCMMMYVWWVLYDAFCFNRRTIFDAGKRTRC